MKKVPRTIKKIQSRKRGEDQKNTDGLTEKALRDLKRGNRLFIKQLVTASSLIRELKDKFYEASRKQTMGKVMVAGLLHDLRNFLALINSCAQFCLENNGLASPGKEKIQMILESAKKAAELARKFLDYSKNSVLDYDRVEVNRTLLAIWKMCELESPPCRVTFEVHLERDLPEIIGSQENLERVFLNLFMNGIHAVSKKGRVIVKMNSLPGEYMVEIKFIDDGPGIPSGKQTRIFEPFYSTKGKGTGLGLSVCQSLIL